MKLKWKGKVHLMKIQDIAIFSLWRILVWEPKY
jgi:hypothetical protein